VRNVTLELANQPIQLQRFGASMVVPRLRLRGYVGQVEVVVTLVTPDGRPHPHRLEGPGCTDGLCYWQGGQEDAVTRHLKSAYSGYNLHGAYRSTEDQRSYERRVTWNLFKSMCCSFRDLLFGQTNLELPDLRIKTVGKYQVAGSLAQRENIALKNSKLERHKLWPPLNDPFCLGFGHKQQELDLSSVRLSFDVTMKKPNGKQAFRPRICDIIYDSTPRILAISELETPAEGGGLIRLNVTRDDVKVKFFDKLWAVEVAVEEPEQGKGFQDIDMESAAELEGPYLAELEVVVPEYPKDIDSKHEVSVQLVTLDGRDCSAAVPLIYLPRAVRREARPPERAPPSDYLSAAVEENDYLASVKRLADQAPPRLPMARRPVRKGRVAEDLPDHIDGSAHKKASQKAILAKFFKDR
jgi:hypothetical protein